MFVKQELAKRGFRETTEELATATAQRRGQTTDKEEKTLVPQQNVLLM